MVDVWNIVHKERESLIEHLSGLSAERWNTPSLCEGWTVHDVLAHLVDDAKTTKLSFVRSLLAARFNFDRVNQNGVNRERQQKPENTLESFRRAANRTSSAPAPLASRLVEIIVHGEDIRRPLEIPHEYPIPAILRGLDYQLSTSDSTGGSKRRAGGLHLITTDADWSHGSGAVVRGRAIDVLMALTGRPMPDGAISGDGASFLLHRKI